jgi:hypothetical protein
MEGMWVKMWDPPKDSPATPDMVAPTNPVPEVMAAAGYALPPVLPHTLQLELLHGLTQLTWDGLKNMKFMTFRSPDIPASSAGTFPGITIRIPNGVVFHCDTKGGGPPPHTIHWHGMEPTPMNDGVGHTSMELGQYTYQLQPNFLGTYFYHCHRNTVQHFEFGLYGALLVEPADAYFATQVLGRTRAPIGHCRDGKRRTAANLVNYPQFPGWNSNPRDVEDPWTGDPRLKFLTDPHAQTVPYDVEALWVFDDRDSVWSDLAPDARATFPKHGTIPGVNDEFHRNPGAQGFFAFNDFNADYWYVTGVPVPCHKYGTAEIPPNIVVPAELNSGISGSQVSVNAFVGQTILIRCLDAAYNSAEYTFPMDIVIIAWDGRALGVPPYGHNEAYTVPANTPIRVSVGRRFDALIKLDQPLNDFAVCKFIDTRGEKVPGYEQVVCTAKVPLNINALTLTPDHESPYAAGTDIVFTAASGGSGAQYRFWMYNGTTWTTVQDYSSTATWTLPATSLPGSYTIAVDARINPAVDRDTVTYASFNLSGATEPATGVTITPSLASPHGPGVPVQFTAAGVGGGGSAVYDYRFKLFNGTVWALVQDYGNGDTWTLPDTTAVGSYTVAVDVRTSTAVNRDTVAYLPHVIVNSQATGVTITPSQPSPHVGGTSVVFTAAGIGASGYQYRFLLFNGTSWSTVQDYGVGDSWTMPASTAVGSYTIAVDVRTSTVVNRDAVAYLNHKVKPAPATGVNVTPSQSSPHATGTSVLFSAAGTGSTGYDYRFRLHNGSSWTIVQNYGIGSSWTLPAATAPGTYTIAAEVRTSSLVDRDSVTYVNYVVTP